MSIILNASIVILSHHYYYYCTSRFASGEFDKSKVRVLVRGDLQHLTGETEGPVTRVESIFILTSIAAYHDLEIFKIDVTSAYLNTPMNDDVKHKWLMLDKDVASILMSMDKNYWKTFLRKDGKILVELDKIMYGRPRTGGTKLFQKCSWTMATIR